MMFVRFVLSWLYVDVCPFASISFVVMLGGAGVACVNSRLVGVLFIMRV